MNKARRMVRLERQFCDGWGELSEVEVSFVERELVDVLIGLVDQGFELLAPPYVDPRPGGLAYGRVNGDNATELVQVFDSMVIVLDDPNQEVL